MKDLPATFNARAETVFAKPMFREAFRQKRCLIPSSDIMEWLKTPTGKQPDYYSTLDGEPLQSPDCGMNWKYIQTGAPLQSCTMIITKANVVASKVHDRMPVLLRREDFDRWLTGTAATELLSYTSSLPEAWPVSRVMNMACAR